MRKTPPAKSRQDSRTKVLLSVRERQFAIGVRTLKSIVEFKSAHLSVFQTEVHELQRQALQGLLGMENVQRDKPLLPAAFKRRNLPKVWLNSLYGRFASPGAQDDE